MRAKLRTRCKGNRWFTDGPSAGEAGTHRAEERVGITHREAGFSPWLRVGVEGVSLLRSTATADPAPGALDVPEEPTLRSRSPAIIALTLGIIGSRTALADEVPHLQWDHPTRCLLGPNDKVLRVQCDDEKTPKVCLVAPNETPDGSDLRHVNECIPVGSKKAYEVLVATGARLVPAVAEVPPGWEREVAHGHAYQTQFDLLDRVYIGAGWAPVYEHSGNGGTAPAGVPFGRAQAEIGMDASVLSPHGRSRHDFQVLQGTATFPDFHFNGVVFAYDYQQLHRRPIFWVTQFFTEPPTVHPSGIPLGWGIRLVTIEDRPPSAPTLLDVEIAETHVSWNPVQSADMYNRLRFEVGGDAGKSWADGSNSAESRWYAGLTAAMHARAAFGEKGRHYAFMDVSYQRPNLIASGDLPAKTVNRLKGQLAYEYVLIAVNDQPLSLRLAVNGAARDDLVTAARNVELGGSAGLRFSFWAPPRLNQPMPELEDP